MVTMTSEVDKTQTSIAMTAKSSASVSVSVSVSGSGSGSASTSLPPTVDSNVISNGNNSNTNSESLSDNLENSTNANVSNERTNGQEHPKPALTPNDNSNTTVTSASTSVLSDVIIHKSPPPISKTASGPTKTSNFNNSTSSSINNTSSNSIGTIITTSNLHISSSNILTTSLTNTTTSTNLSPSQTSSTNISNIAPPSSSNGVQTKSNVLAVPSKSHNHQHQHHPPLPQQSRKNEDAPNIMVYKKMEATIEKMQAENTGVQVRTVKAFMTKVPSVFTGADLVSWILKNTDVEDVTEALHFAHLLAAHGYIFPIDDHALTVKNDGTFYRFQTPYFWPSNCWEPENTDYAVYLCKRTMQNKTRLELADYEAENLAKLQKMFSRKWEFIFMQAESQSKVAKKRDKLERKVLDSQERAFWDVHRPMPGCVNTTEIDIKKAYRRGFSSHGTGSGGASLAKNPIEQLTRLITLRKQKLERRTIKVSKAAESLVAYYEQYCEFDYFITSPELPNPWQTDSPEMWDAEKNTKEVTLRRVKRWGFSLRELLIDPIGREQFAKFLEKEYSGENLKFWESVQHMKALPQSEIKEAIQKIWQEFLGPDAPCPVNVDSKSVELAREAVNSTNGPNRWCFDVAASHVYHLMKSDSYSRYLRSDMYKDYLSCSRKKIKSIPNLFGVKR